MKTIFRFGGWVVLTLVVVATSGCASTGKCVANAQLEGEPWDFLSKSAYHSLWVNGYGSPRSR